MSQWLKWRLVALFCAVALCGGTTYLHAQNGYPPPAKTPEAAGEKFAQMLALGGENGYVDYTPSNAKRYDSFQADGGGIVSRRNYEALGDNLARLTQSLAGQQKMPQFNGRAVSNDGQSAVVEVVPATAPKPLPLVVVAEDGGWRVDVIATYAKLNNLEGDALGDALLRITGTVPQGFPSSENMRRASCQSNLKQIMLGVLQYSQDYDEKQPPARRWADVLQPYLKSRQIFNCPSLPAGRKNGYAFNQNLSQFVSERIQNPSALVNVYETTNLAENVFGPGTARAYRHEGGANFGFADGHVKWFKRGSDTSLPFQP